MRKKIFTFLLALAASIGMMNAKVTWNSSNISDLSIYGTGSYSKEGVKLSTHGDEINARWKAYGDESKDGISFNANQTGGFTFSNTLGKNFTKIEMTLVGPGGWDMANLGSGWSIEGEPWDVMKVIWTGNASTVDLLKEASDFHGDYVKSIVLYFVGDSEAPDPTYTVALQAGTANANKVTLSATSAVEGATITVTPDEEYEITAFSAKYNTTEEAPSTLDPGTGAYSFTMPAYDVTIEATIALKPVPEGDVFAGFTATAGSGGFDNEGSANLVDNKFTSADWTKWCTNFDHMSVPTGETGDACWWIDFEASAALNLTGYILTTGNDTGNEHGRNPKNWVLKAKLNAGDAWTTIATVTNDVTMKNKSFKDYKFFVDQSGTYQYFRFEVFANQGAGVMQLCELRLIGAEPVVVTTHTLQLHVNDALMGSVALQNPSNDIVDNGDGTYTVPEGAEVTILATPNEGYEFIGWKASSSICDFNECEFDALPTVDNPLTVDMYMTAAFMAEFAAVAPAAPVGPTYLDADFAIDFRTDPYTKVGGGDLPSGVLVEGSMNTGDPQHGYRLPVITIPVTAGNYKVMMGTCSYSNQDATVKTEDGSHTYATLATNNGTCYHNNTAENVVGAIFTVPTDQIIKVYGAEYTPFFSIEKMAAVPAFTDFELNFQTNPYNEISGAKPEGTVIIGTYHDNLHGYQNVEAVVPVEAGNYRLTVGACQYGTPGNVMSETNAELASFNSNLGEGNCYHNNTAANIVSTIFTVDMDQTITINGGAYMPYMKLEKLLDNTYYINFENAEGAIGTVPGEVAIAAGESWTIPANLTLYKEGYTFVGWSDGVNTYAPGDEFFPSAHGTLEAVYTANTVSVADASTINVKWYFGENAGAPSVTWQGTTGYLLAKGEVDGELIDLKLDIDATSGKFHNAGRGDKWAQVNANTVFTFPSKEGAVVNVETYSGNATYDLAAGTLTCNTNDYYSYLEIVYPAPTTAVEIGDLNNAEEVTAFLTTYEGQTVPDLTIDRPVLNNMYNTLCLPFHMDADQIANSSLNGVEIYEFVDADVTNDELYLYTSEEKHEIVAGRPYLVKFSAASQLDELNFIDVVINNADLDNQAVTIKGVTFKGTFQPIVLGAQTELDFNGGHLFLMANNTLMWPNTNNPLKPFRAYFTVNVDAGQSAGMPVRRGMPAHIGGPAQILTGVENVQGDNVQGTKVVENGVLYIIKNGVRYNAQGQIVK